MNWWWVSLAVFVSAAALWIYAVRRLKIWKNDRYDDLPVSCALAIIVTCISLVFLASCFALTVNSKERYYELKEEQEFIGQYATYTAEELNRLGIYQVVAEEISDYNRDLAEIKSKKTALGNWSFYTRFDWSDFDYIYFKGE